MTRPLAAFAAKLQADGEDDPEAVIKSAAQNRRDELERALEQEFDGLTASQSEQQRRTARLLYAVSDVIPEVFVAYGTELTAVVDDDTVQPYVDGALTNAVFQGLGVSSDKERLIEKLAEQTRAGLASTGDSTDAVSQADATAALRYLSWLAKRWDNSVATVDTTIIECLSSDITDIQREAASILAVTWAADFDATGALPPLLELTADSRPVVRATAIAALGRIGFPERAHPEDLLDQRGEIIATAADCLTDDDQRVRYDAAHLLAETSCEIDGQGEVRWPDIVDDADLIQRVVDQLVDRLSDPVSPVQRRAASALSGYTLCETDALVDHIDRLVEYGWDETQPNHRSIQQCVKRTAADDPSAIVTVEEPSALADHASLFLEQLDENRSVDAVELINEIATEDIDAVRDAIPILVDMLASPRRQGRVRQTAAMALVEFYKEDPESVPDYVEVFVAASDDPDVNTNSRNWEPLIPLAADYPDVAAEIAVETVDRAVDRDGSSGTLFAKKLADTEISDEVIDRLREVIQNGDSSAAAHAIETLRHLYFLDDPPELPPSTRELVEDRFDELPQESQFDAERLLTLLEEQ